MVLQPKSPLEGYSLILGRPWLAIVDPHIGFRSRSMVISHERYTKQLTIFTPSKPNIHPRIIFWVEKEGSDEGHVVHQHLSIDQYLNI